MAVLNIAYVLVDQPNTEETILTKADLAANGIRPYCSLIHPLNVRDFDQSQRGDFNWAIIRSTQLINDINQPKAVEKTYWTYWDKQIWEKYERDAQGNDAVVAGGTHGLGIVPLIPCIEGNAYAILKNKTWFEDVAYLARALFNDGSVLDQNIWSQVFGKGYIAADEGEVDLSKVSVHNMMTIPKTSPFPPGYMVPPAGAIVEPIQKEMERKKLALYFMVGLVGNKDSKAAESGESKAWDHAEMEQFIVNRSIKLEEIENRIGDLQNRWTKSSKAKKSTYPKEFKVWDLQKEVQGILGLQNMRVGKKFQSILARYALEIMKSKVNVTVDEEQEVLQEIEDMKQIESVNPDLEM
jgi:hypothetical protein